MEKRQNQLPNVNWLKVSLVEKLHYIQICLQKQTNNDPIKKIDNKRKQSSTGNGISSPLTFGSTQNLLLYVYIQRRNVIILHIQHYSKQISLTFNLPH